MAAARSWEELERRLNDPCGLGGVNVGRVGTSDVSTDREDSEPEDITDEVRAEVARRSMTESQKVLMDSGNSMQKLAAMCQGLCTKIDDSGGDRPLLDLDGEDPVCMTLPNKSHYNPAVPILKLEVRRRAKMFNINLATSTMSRPALLTWLKSNPIINCLDEDCLQKEEAKIYDVAKQAMEEQAELAAARLRNSNWNSPKPWLRFYLALSDDDARRALLQKDHCMDRAELDAGDWSDRPESFEEAVACVYNDEAKVLTTEALPSLHEMFAEPMELRFSDMPGGKINAEDVKSRLGDCRAKLVQVSTCVSLV